MRNRRTVETQPVAAPVVTLAQEPAFRLRHLMLSSALGLAIWLLFPAAKAAWQLHDAATALADYARCMAGPTGPVALRDTPDVFRSLVRRRLLTAQPEDHPFAACVSLAREVAPGAVMETGHAAAARQFFDYSESEAELAKAADVDSFDLSQVVLSTDPLEQLADHAWPFERRGFKHLLEPSSTAKEAAHPVEFPYPVLGSGFVGKHSIYRTTWYARDRWFAAFGEQATLSVRESLDHGLTWKPTSVNQPALAKYAGRCAALGSNQSFTVERDAAGQWQVQSWVGDQNVSAARLPSGVEVARTTCDANVLLLVVTAKQKLPGVLSCEHARGCALLPLEPAWLASDFDVAQVEGVSVVLTSGRGIARVRSSRDRGQSFTPAIVAYDAQAYPGLTEAPAPNQLSVMGRRLMLLGAGEGAGSYPVLYSDDFGVSFIGAENARRQAAPSTAQAAIQRPPH